MEQVVIVTTTFYRSPDELRYRLAQCMISAAIAASHTVLIVDGSPDAQIPQSFEKMGATVFRQQAPGMGPSRRELFQHAGDQDTYGGSQFRSLVWLEPEKVDLVRWIPDIVAPIQRDEAAIVIPERTEASWASYPAFQIESEQGINRLYAAVTGRWHDMAFGPIAFRWNLAPICAACDPEKSYGGYDTYIQQIAAMEAMARGYRVASVPVDFTYPPEQKEEEEVTLRDTMLHYRWRNAMKFSETVCLAARALQLR